MFGTDLSPGTGAYDWEETGYMFATDSRQALALALTGMLGDGEISRADALSIANQVMRGTALKLYKLPAN